MTSLIPDNLIPIEFDRSQQKKLFYLIDLYFHEEIKVLYYDGHGYYIMEKRTGETLKFSWLQLCLFAVPSKILEDERNLKTFQRIPIFMRQMNKINHPLDVLWSYWKTHHLGDRIIPEWVEEKEKIGFKFGPAKLN